MWYVRNKVLYKKTSDNGLSKIWKEDEGVILSIVDERGVIYERISQSILQGIRDS